MVKRILDAEINSLLQPTYARRSIREAISATQIPASGMSAEEAVQLCEDELSLDGTPGLNLASFVTTWMEPQAKQLILDNLNKNLVDQDEYPHAVMIERRCISMLAALYHAPGIDAKSDINTATGTSTVGSSEAVMLAGLALKWRWRDLKKKNNQDYSRPNIVMGTNVQVVWEKFAKYFDVEPKFIGVSAEHATITPEQVLAAVDENTIGVVGILGTTFTGEYEDIAAISKALDQYCKQFNIDIPIHVDAASGGFVAPFVHPKLKWDFRLSRVASINVSGHKYGLVYPGVGWVIWRDKSSLPKDLIFDVNYLGGHMPTFNLNFSRPSAFVVAQYYNFLRLGKTGYKGILSTLLQLTERLQQGLLSLDCFNFLSKPDSLPVIAVSLQPDKYKFDVYQLSTNLRIKKWIVPAYTLPKPADQTSVLRFVIREGMSAALIDQLIIDVKSSMLELQRQQYSDKQHSKGSKSHYIC